MRMSVEPIPTVSDRINEIRRLTARIVNDEILPNENMLWGWRSGQRFTEADREESRHLREHIKERVRQAGLWAPHLPAEYGGAGLDFLEHAYMNEVLAYAVGAASLFGVVAPNSGNQSILLKYGTEEQKKKWLIPSIEGKLESGFSMTEPDAAGSDPRSLQTTARRDGDEWLINGHKWFTSNGKRADFFIVMCRTEEGDGAGDRNSRMTQIIVPARHTRRERGPGHHSVGSGLRPLRDHLRQRARPGGEPTWQPRQRSPGCSRSARGGARYHCMNSIGQMCRAFDLMVERVARAARCMVGCSRRSSSSRGSSPIRISTFRRRG